MSDLMRAELLRLVSRRLVIVLLVCMAALAAFGAAIEADGARPLSDSERQESLQFFNEERSAWESSCGDTPDAEMCLDWEVTDDPADFLRSPATFGQYAYNTINLGVLILLFSVGLLAASFVGSEFSSGNIGTQLLFTPRRTSLMMAKVVAAAVGGLALAVVYLTCALAFSAIMFLSLRGAADMTAGPELLILARMLVLTALFAIVGAAFGTAVGSALVAVGTVALIFVVSATTASTLSGFSVVQLFLPSNLLIALIDGQHEVLGYTPGAEEWETAHTITYGWALGGSVAATVLIVLASAWWFRRRDILS